MTDRFAGVRLAATSDEHQILELLHQMHGEGGLGRFDDDRVRAIIRAGTAQYGGVVGVIRGRDTVEATIGLFLAESWYSADRHLFDLWSFVGEPYRRSTHAKSMIQFAKEYAVDLGVPLMMTIVSNEQTARKEKLLERQLPRAGSLFIFNSSVGAEA